MYCISLPILKENVYKYGVGSEFSLGINDKNTIIIIFFFIFFFTKKKNRKRKTKERKDLEYDKQF